MGDTFGFPAAKNQRDMCPGRTVKVVGGLDLYKNSCTLAAPLRGIRNDLRHLATVTTQQRRSSVTVRTGIVSMSQIWNAIGDLAGLVSHRRWNERCVHIRGLAIGGIGGGIIVHRSGGTVIYHRKETQVLARIPPQGRALSGM